ncbi:rab effector Noc2 [Trichonephila clavipes]|nr:rab effector Noc2 [Trichonephila clavipes]
MYARGGANKSGPDEWTRLDVNYWFHLLSPDAVLHRSAFATCRPGLKGVKRRIVVIFNIFYRQISSKLSKLDYSSSFRPRGGSMGDFGVARDKWVCPNDRELSLRAKLRTGWSVKTNSINSFNKPEQLNDSEQEIIMSVIKRAENLDKVEQERIG